MTDDGTRETRRRGGGLFDRVVGTFVNPAVDALDVEGLVERIDVNDVIDRVDVDELIARIDVNELLDRVDVNRVLDRVEPDALLDRVDPDRLLDRVDPNALLDRVDADRLLDRVDANALIERVDVDRLIGRIDIDALMDRVDVNRIVERAELGPIIARSTTGVFSELLDAARMQAVTVDQITHGIVNRVLRRPARQGPGRPEDPDDRPDLRGSTSRGRADALDGHYAGSVTRFLAFLVDQFVAGLLFALGVQLVESAASVVFDRDVSLDNHRWLAIALISGWYFLYYVLPLTVAGRTIGKAVAGLKVVQASGADVTGRHAVVRTLAFPISFLLFGVGLLIGLVRVDRRMLHDLVAGTSVIYLSDERAAALHKAHADGQVSHPVT